MTEPKRSRKAGAKEKGPSAKDVDAGRANRALAGSVDPRTMGGGFEGAAQPPTGDLPVKVGQPVEYSEAIEAEILERLGNGEFLRVICRDPHMPAWTTVYGWMNRDQGFRERIAQARVAGFDAIAEDSLVMLDEKPARHSTAFGDKIDPAHVAWTKQRAEQRLKLLEKWAPTVYGQQVNVKHSGEVKAVLEMDADHAARVAQTVLAGLKGGGE